MGRSEIMLENQRLSQGYTDLIQEFIDVGWKDCVEKRMGGLRCPCIDCLNNAIYEDVDVVREHLVCRGFDPTYTTWVWHGEGASHNDAEFDVKLGADGLRYDGCLDEMAEDVAMDWVGKPSMLAAMYNDKETPLYKGCKHSVLGSTLLLMNLKARHGISDKGMTELLELVKELLPTDNLCPDRVYAAKKILCPMGMEMQKIHACPNDCLLYREDDKDRDTCRVCNEPRYKSKVGTVEVCGESVTPSRCKTPAKVVYYLPLIPRLKRLFANPEDAKLLTWHADRAREDDDIISHASDGDQWKKMDERYPEFAAEPRNVRLGLSTDGMNPFGNMSSTHSSWPVMVVIYNLPSWLMMKRKYVLLSMMISGPKQPGNDIDVYLAPLIEDLQKLFDVGVRIPDGSRGDEEFKLQGMLLWSINDFPALGNLGGYSVKGHFACPICESKTSYCQLKHGGKPVYLGHRRFLPTGHPWRRAKNWFNGREEHDPSPIPLTGEEVLEKVTGMDHEFGKGKKKKASNSSWKKCSIFFKLDYWKHLDVRHCLDVMHIEKNVCEALVGTLMNTPGKTKDGLKARKDLVQLGIRSSLAPVEEEGKSYLPPACYTMSTEEKKRYCNALKSVKVPTGYSSNIRNCVNTKELKLAGLKSHDCHNLMQELNVIALRGSLPRHVRKAISKLCYFFKCICRKRVSRQKLDELQEMVVEVLCRMEMYFPPAFFDIMIHVIVHLVREVKLCGPVYLRWMYPFERYMSIFKHFVKNRYRPDASIVQRYVAEEVIEFCTNYMKDVATVGIPNARHDGRVDGHGLKHHSLFSPTAADMDAVHLYILRNHEAVTPYVDIHMDQIRVSNAWTVGDVRILEKHCANFVRWLQAHIQQGDHPDIVKLLCRRPLGTVSSFGGYDINGYTFGTKWSDERSTNQNSGVVVPGEAVHGCEAYYGTITDIWEIDFISATIPVFKCEWVKECGGVRKEDYGTTLVNRSVLGSEGDSFIMASQAHQVFYVTDPQDNRWEIVVNGKQALLHNGNDEDRSFGTDIGDLLGLEPNETLTEDEASLKRYFARNDHTEGIWITNAGKPTKRKRNQPKNM